jgi:cytoskeleton protein RodZ
MSRKRSPATVGAKLRKARERCRLSLRQIADSTKISVPVLEGLERDVITHMPGGVLGRGYVRSFAAAVKLDPEATVAEFVAQFPESSVKDGYPPAARVDEGNTTRIRLHDSGRVTRVASVGVVAVLLAGVIAFAAPKRWPPWTALQGRGTSADVATSGSAHERQFRTLDARPLPLIQPSKPPTLPSTRALPVTVRAKSGSAKVSGSSKRALKTPVAASPTATVVAPESSAANDESAAGAKPAETPAPADAPAPSDPIPNP